MQATSFVDRHEFPSFNSFSGYPGGCWAVPEETPKNGKCHVRRLEYDRAW